MSKEIHLTQGKVAIVDDADFDCLNQWKWCAMKGHATWYAVRKKWQSGKQNAIYMHREILELPTDIEADHKDGNGLHNRRCNLRAATRAQNMCNRRKGKGTSKFKGVCWHWRTAKWRARIQVEGKRLHLGLFNSEFEAAKTYDKAARKYFGEYAYLNAV